jgi:hypothetical protein
MSTNSGITKYGDFDLGQMEDAEKALPAGGGGNFYEPKDGKNVIRFLPPLQGRKALVIWYKHFFSAGSERKTIVCTKMQFSQPCPVCDQRMKLASSSNRADQKLARGYEPSAKACVNIVDMKNPEKGVQVFRISPGLFKKIRKAIDIADVGKVFADPLKGFNIIFGKSGSGLNTEYDPVAVARESTPLADADELIQSQVDLETLEAAPSDEEQEEALDGEFESADARKGGRGGKDKGGDKDKGRSGRAPAARGTDDADIEY